MSTSAPEIKYLPEGLVTRLHSDGSAFKATINVALLKCPHETTGTHKLIASSVTFGSDPETHRGLRWPEVFVFRASSDVCQRNRYLNTTNNTPSAIVDHCSIHMHIFHCIHQPYHVPREYCCKRLHIQQRVGSFTSPSIDTRYKGHTAFRCLLRKNAGNHQNFKTTVPS